MAVRWPLIRPPATSESPSLPVDPQLPTMLASALKQTASKMTAGKRAISSSAKRLGEDHHHEHLLFEGEFSKKWVGGLTAFVIVGGIAVPMIALKLQNWKHGFPQQ